MPSVTVIVGASRGIGGEFVRQLSADGDSHVVAAMRKPQPTESSNVQVIALDQANASSVDQAAKLIPEIDTLIINAAMGNDELLVNTSSDRLAEYLETNVIGVHRVIQAFLPALRARQTRRIILISSTSGSLTKQIGATQGFCGPYSVTKAAGNMLVVQYHNELHADGFTVIAVCPGWVATDMGNIAGGGGMPVEKSVSSMLAVFKGLKLEDSAKFYRFDGSIVPW